MTVLETLAASPLSTWVLESSWGYYGLLSVHAIGMAGIVGSTFMLCLRVLGYARGVRVSDLARLRALALWGFIVNAVSGAILFCSNAVQLAQNFTFQVKLISIVLGCIALGILWRMISRSPGKDDPAYSYGVAMKVVAIATLLFWTIAIIFGREIAYTLEPVIDGLVL